MEKKKCISTPAWNEEGTSPPFAMPMDGMLGHEASMVLKKLSRILAQKWDCTITWHWPCKDGAGIGLLQTAEF
eukprot:7695206-Ditylum_brightwellii.AAC.1